MSLGPGTFICSGPIAISSGSHLGASQCDRASQVRATRVRHVLDRVREFRGVAVEDAATQQVKREVVLPAVAHRSGVSRLLPWCQGAGERLGRGGCGISRRVLIAVHLAVMQSAVVGAGSSRPAPSPTAGRSTASMRQSNGREKSPKLAVRYGSRSEVGSGGEGYGRSSRRSAKRWLKPSGMRSSTASRGPGSSRDTGWAMSEENVELVRRGHEAFRDSGV